MKLFALLILPLGLFAQASTHKAALTWSDTLNPAGTTYNVYRAPGLCSGTPTFAKIASAIATKNYDDTTVQPGNYCYAVTATFNGMESAQSNTALAPIPSFPPATLAVMVQ